MDGKQFQKILLDKGISKSGLLIAEYVLLFGVGIIAILLHSKFRYPMNIPGHHGLEFMALLMAGRSLSGLRWASSVSSLGIGFILLFPVFGFKDPFMGINYMFPGFVLDAGYHYLKNARLKLLLLTLLAGFSYFSIPLSRLILQAVTGYQYMSFIKLGFLLPPLNFFIFGMTGGFIGLGASGFIIKRISKTK